jgi:bifunctional DNA-binding transcriptional regulator/antitoxin component of YhaV-PrlF toxin-antitoxin module
MPFQVTVAPNGRISLLVELRRRLGLIDGGELLIEERTDGLILRTVKQSVAHAQALARQYTAHKAEASVEAFLVNRLADSGE